MNNKILIYLGSVKSKLRGRNSIKLRKPSGKMKDKSM